MHCIVCNGEMHYVFSKQFDEYGLGQVDYWRCDICGFSASKTHYDMPDAAWEQLNHDFHETHLAREDNPYGRNQRYFAQALMLHLLARHGMIPEAEWLDWGCGKASLAVQLQAYFGLSLASFDRYTTPDLNPVREEDLLRRGYGLVISTAVFEHVRTRAQLDEIESFVAADGHLAVHTLVW